MSESVPNSTASFAHRNRAASTGSFAFYDESHDAEIDAWMDEEGAILDDLDEEADGHLGFAAYVVLCVLTGGLLYLVFRWVPKWRIRLVGARTLLRECEWVAVEDQWGGMEELGVGRQAYGRSLSSVFGPEDEKGLQRRWRRRLRRRRSSYMESEPDDYATDIEDDDDYDDDNDPVVRQLRTLDYRYMRFCYHPLRDKFVPGNTWKDRAWTDASALRTGLDSDERESRTRLFGPNLIDIEQKSIAAILVDEVLHPFYIFQIFSLILWAADDYYYYAAAILAISLFGIGAALQETRANQRKMHELSRFECATRVLRSGFWRQVPSAELVPGDVFEVSDPGLSQMPCDCLLLSGDAIVNESMLTGESLPVSKMPVTDDALAQLSLGTPSVHPAVGKHMLFCGTRLVRVRRPPPHDSAGHPAHASHADAEDEPAALAMVARTGFNTTKGALVRSMLFSKPVGFELHRDAFRYVGVMAVVAAIGFLASVANFVRLGVEWHVIVVRALDLITIVVPPALPATLTVGTTFAQERLKKKSIFCIAPQRVAVGGKLDVVCFDKTGTLTEDGLDVLGVRVVEKPNKSGGDTVPDGDGSRSSESDTRFSPLIASPETLVPTNKLAATQSTDADIDYSPHRALLYAMATCHTLRHIDGALVGDPLDERMFAFTGWSYEEGTGGEDAGGGPVDEDVLGGSGSLPQQPRLSPSVARPPPPPEDDANGDTSSSYESSDADSAHAVLRKRTKPLELGVLKAFEFVSQLRRSSVVVRRFGEKGGEVYVKGAPEVMEEICRKESFPADYEDLLSHYTHRGFRVIACATKSIPKLNWVKVQKMKREEAETNLTFVGFIIFENKLKGRTTEIIGELGRANIRRVMCTGDNILTAISVARECGMIDKTAYCFIPHFVHGDAHTALSQISWHSVDNPMVQLDEKTLKPLPPPADVDVSLPYDMSNFKNYSLAVTGDVFRWIVDYAKEDSALMHAMLVRGQVFARMSPDEKHELVEKLQGIEYCCAFCGDGANDCGALKSADVGISLSDAEASVAAPFTSRIFDISCVPEVIREGRASLVTSFTCFKYMSLYSAIQFTSVSFLYATASNLGDFQFLYIDLLVILPIALAMGWTAAYPILSTKPPTASLMSRIVLIPLLGQIAICVLIQAVAYKTVQSQPWFKAPQLDKDKSNSKNSENTALFLVSCYQYILSAIVLNIGPPYRQPMRTNMPLMIAILLTFLVSTYMLFAPARWLFELMELTFMSPGFKSFLFALGVGGFAVSYLAERHIFPSLAGLMGTAKRILRSDHRRERKRYETIEESMRT
ncbi:hypothetical protein BDY21DRAFT_39066 [Lineolata rhizophorae]|uniref:Cation-transporting ATPase n=1 Tax=Lineolata rhizophorae TaxID=578093 RepID=A0A6A6P0J9_9PEZI|nr:hypothetical protein BDY21DRAFT_39066 [Lineolata rhizophorae]